MKVFIIMFSFFSFNSFSLAPSPDECKQLIKKFNQKHGKSVEWGYDFKNKSLVMMGTKGMKLSSEIKAGSSEIKRICMAAGLPLNYYMGAKGTNKAITFCQITTSKNLSGVCSPSDTRLEFRKPK